MKILSYQPSLFNIHDPQPTADTYVARPGDGLLKVQALYESIRRAIDSYKTASARLDDVHARYLEQALRSGASPEKLKAVADRYSKAHQQLSEGLSEEILRWGQDNKGTLELLGRLNDSVTIYMPAASMGNAPFVQKLRVLANSLGLIQGGRVRYTAEGEILARKAQAALEGKQYVEPKRMETIVQKKLEEYRSQLQQREQELKQLTQRFALRNNQLEGIQRKQDQASRQERAEALKIQNELTALADDIKGKSAAIADQQEQIVYVTGLAQYGHTAPRNFKGGKSEAAEYARKLLEEAAQTLKYQAGGGIAGVTFKSGLYKGLTPDEVPIDYLIWIARGSEIREMEKVYRTTAGHKLQVPITFARYRNAFPTDGNMRRFVIDYLSSGAGKRRLEEYYRDTYDENIRVLLGAVPELEELSRRTAELRRGSVRTPRQGAGEGMQAARRLLESMQLYMERNKYAGVYKEVYHKKLAEVLLPFLGLTQKSDQKEIDRLVRAFLEERGYSTEARRAQGIARAAAQKAYEAELASHNLDDYSVLYRQYLKAGLTPEEAQDVANRAVKETTRNWRTPAGFSGHGQSKKELEALQEEEKAAEKDMLRQLAATHPEVLSPLTLSRIDPNWRSRSGDWYGFRSRAAWEAWRRLSEQLDTLKGGLLPSESESIASKLKRLDKLEQKLLRQFVNTQDDIRDPETGKIIFSGEGEVKQPVHPAVDELSKEMAELRAKLELMQRNLHASGETTEEPETTGPTGKSMWAEMQEMLAETPVPGEPRPAAEARGVRGPLSDVYVSDLGAIDEALDEYISPGYVPLEEATGTEFPGRRLARLFNQLPPPSDPTEQESTYQHEYPENEFVGPPEPRPEQREFSDIFPAFNLPDERDIKKRQ